MSDIEYIKELEYKIAMMDKVIEGKDAEIAILKKNCSLPSRVANRMERKFSEPIIDVNSLTTKVGFKFSIATDELQDALIAYDGDDYIKAVERIIIEASKKTICDFIESRKSLPNKNNPFGLT